MGEYDDSGWLTMFRMRKYSVFALSKTLAPQVHKKDTRYQMAIPMIIRVACTLFKLTHGVSFLICSEMFAIGKSTVCAVLRDVVHAIDDTLKHNISWHVGDCLRQSQEKFVDLCGLPGVIGAIDGTHISIAKPRHVPVNYYYFKLGGYTLNCQAVVDNEKHFLDLYLGMPGSTNDSRMLRRSTLYNVAIHSNFFNNMVGSEGQSREDVECLYKVLQNEGLHGKVVDDIAGEAEVANGHEGADAILETLGTASALQKRQLLGMYLTTQRPQMP